MPPQIDAEDAGPFVQFDLRKRRGFVLEAGIIKRAIDADERFDGLSDGGFDPVEI